MKIIKKLKVKKEITKIDNELKNVRICMLYWSHGEMGYTQSKDEIEELENQEQQLIERRNACYNDLILLNVAEGLNAKKQEKRDKINKDFETLVYARDHNN